MKLAAAAILLFSAPLARPLPGCSVAVTPLVFGRYDPLSAAPLDATATLSWTCTGPAALTIALGPGGFERRMQGPGTLRYALYLDPARTAVWGDGAGGSSVRSLSGRSGSVPVYARLPPGQKAPPGTYADRILVSITF